MYEFIHFTGCFGCPFNLKTHACLFRKVFFFFLIYLKSLSLICFSLISFWKFYLSNAASLGKFSNFLTFFFFFSHFLFLFLLILGFGEFLLYFFLWNHHLWFFLNKIHGIFLSCDHSFFFFTYLLLFWVCNWHSFSFFLPEWFLCLLSCFVGVLFLFGLHLLHKNSVMISGNTLMRY